MIVASHRFASMKELFEGAAVEVAHATGSTAALVPIWNEAVGPSIAKNATPHALYPGVLVVKVSNQQWIDAIALREAEIVGKLSSKLNVKKLRLEVASP